MSVMKMIRILKILIGAAGWVWFAIPVVFSGIFSLGNAAGLLFFGVLFLWGIFQKKLLVSAKAKKWARALRGILITGYAAFILLFSVETVLMVNAINARPPEGATVVVLGCAVRGTKPSQMLSLRIDAAEKYLRENPDAVAVLSGGQGDDEEISEGQCMFNELTARGISPDRLYVEDRSTSTRENICYSAEIIKENGLSENLAVVSNNFHLYRASLVVKNEGYNFYSVSADTPLTLFPTYWMREYLGIVAQWVAG